MWKLEAGNSTRHPAACANCGIAIRWQPTVVDGKVYCCLGCANGGPCECDYDHLPMPGDRVSLVVRVTYTSSWVYTSENT